MTWGRSSGLFGGKNGREGREYREGRDRTASGGSGGSEGEGRDHTDSDKGRENRTLDLRTLRKSFSSVTGTKGFFSGKKGESAVHDTYNTKPTDGSLALLTYYSIVF